MPQVVLGNVDLSVEYGWTNVKQSNKQANMITTCLRCQMKMGLAHPTDSRIVRQFQAVVALANMCWTDLEGRDLAMSISLTQS